jgi:phage baseplate assembly protein gpV
MIDETMAEGEDIPADPSTLIRLGTITAVTLSPPRCVVRYGDPEADEDCETPPIRWLALRAGKTRHWSPPVWARKPCCCAPMARSAMAWPCQVALTKTSATSEWRRD